jgi:hypothetical protein
VGAVLWVAGVAAGYVGVEHYQRQIDTVYGRIPAIGQFDSLTTELRQTFLDGAKSLTVLRRPDDSPTLPNSDSYSKITRIYEHLGRVQQALQASGPTAELAILRRLQRREETLETLVEFSLVAGVALGATLTLTRLALRRNAALRGR